ncbi:MAG: TA system VapC family ribonuclease toxin [Nocardioides sp.]
MTEPVDSRFFLPDVNVLVALTNPSHQHHRLAHEWLSTVQRYATTPITENGLIRLLLNPGVIGQEVGRAQAVGIVAGLRADRRASFLADGSSLTEPAIDLAGFVGHRQATDFHLVNLAASSGAVLATLDRRIKSVLTAADMDSVHVL